jgi:hypothetical protein
MKFNIEQCRNDLTTVTEEAQALRDVYMKDVTPATYSPYVDVARKQVHVATMLTILERMKEDWEALCDQGAFAGIDPKKYINE